MTGFLIYFSSALLSYGMWFGHFQNNPDYKRYAEETYRSDMAAGLFVALFSPVSTVVLFLIGFAQHGLKFR